MDPFKQITEHHVYVQNEVNGEKKITKEQEILLYQLHLANVLLFRAWTLNPEQEKEQQQLQQKYFQNLAVWSCVKIWLQWLLGSNQWIVVSNDGQIIKVQSSYYGNKKKKEWIRSFSAIDWYSKWFLFTPDDYYWGWSKQRFYIAIPESYTVKSTAWIPQKALDEINEIYKQAGDEKTCYDLVNNLKYWNPIPENDFIF